MSKGSTMSRRQRRGQFKQMGYLKIKNMFGRFSEQGMAWYNKMQKDGREAHEAHVRRVEENIGEQLEIKLNSCKETWKSIGYNAKEIKLLEEAFALTSIKDNQTYRADKKESRRLQREASESLKSRLNAKG